MINNTCKKSEIIFRMFQGIGMIWAPREWQILIPTFPSCSAWLLLTTHFPEQVGIIGKKIMERKVRFSWFPSWITHRCRSCADWSTSAIPKEQKVVHCPHQENSTIANRKGESFTHPHSWTKWEKSRLIQARCRKRHSGPLLLLLPFSILQHRHKSESGGWRCRNDHAQVNTHLQLHVEMPDGSLLPYIKLGANLSRFNPSLFSKHLLIYSKTALAKE